MSIMKKPQIVVRNGKPSAVILDIEEYEELLERAEEMEDLKILRALRRRSLTFRKFEDFVREYRLSV